MLKKIEDRSCIVGVIGLGYVGIPLALRFCDEGFRVVGVDVDETQVDKLNGGKSPIKHISDDAIAGMIDARFEATSDFSRVGELDAIVICVPTPLDQDHNPDLSHITATMEAIQPHLKAGQIVSLESTTWPGTTSEILKPYIEQRGFRPGKDFFLVFSPEREDPGNQSYSVRTIPKVVGGITPACLEVGVALYEAIVDEVVPVSSTDAAEMVKLVENIHRSVNIGLVNEMKIVADKMGLDIFEIIGAAATKPFGFTPYFPGPGAGGHCIPIDPHYLNWKARQFGIESRFVELAGEINDFMPRFVVSKLSDALEARGRTIRDGRFLVLGVAYKSNVDDMRESPALDVIKLIDGEGGAVSYSDPFVPVLKLSGMAELLSIDLSEQSVAEFDAILLLTRHDSVDYGMIEKFAQLIIDTRNQFDRKGENVVPA